jgi:hypothetical protein
MEAGLGVEKRGSKFHVASVRGLCQNIPLQVGDELLKLNDRDLKGEKLKDVQRTIEESLRLEMVVRRCDPDNLVFEDDADAESEQEEEYQENDRRSRRFENEEEEEYDSSEAEYGFFNGENSSDGLFRPGSAARLDNIGSKPYLNGQTVEVKHESSKKPGTFECELQDGSRVSVSQMYMTPIAESERDDFQPYIPGSARSLAVCNLIEPGDVMKIRGLKKQAKMNGTMVEMLRPSETQPGRWECVLCDDKDRVICIRMENLRHIM